ncbi:MAG: hypothetical protein KGO05_12390, partial [Chloroflexota bacterium]|nr:hypothetical protein [Chloroflexota bacterium]
VAINLATGRATVFNSLCARINHILREGECAQQMSGIWSRGGVVVDPTDGSIFVDTGNGDYNANRGGDDYGDSIIHLSADATTILDTYTPPNYQRLDDTDADLGSSAPALLPTIATSRTPLLLVQGGKDGQFRLIDRADMSGKGGPGHVGGALQTLDLGCGLFTQPTIWTDPATGRIWVIVSSVCGMRAYQVKTDASGVTRLALVWQNGDAMTTPVIAGGALFAAGSGALRAYDPPSGRTLWSSDQSSANGTISGIHWESPIVVGGAVYISDENATLTCYGLKS